MGKVSRGGLVELGRESGGLEISSVLTATSCRGQLATSMSRTLRNGIINLILIQ